MNSSEKEEAGEGDRHTPAVHNLLAALANLAGVTDYYLMDKQGKIVAHSPSAQHGTDFSDFITYCIVGGVRMRQSLETRGPHRMWFTLPGEEKIFIFPAIGMIIVLFLSADLAIDAVTAQLHSIIATLGTPGDV